MAFLLCPKCRPCDIQCAPNAPVASISSPAPSANPDVIHSASNDPTVCEAVALSRVAPLSMSHLVLGTGSLKKSTQKRQLAPDPLPIHFPSAPSSVASGAPVAKRSRQSDFEDKRFSSDDASIPHPTGDPAPNAPAEPEVLIMRGGGAEKPFMVYSQTCQRPGMNGCHLSISLAWRVRKPLQHELELTLIISSFVELRSTAVGV